MDYIINLCCQVDENTHAKATSHPPSVPPPKPDFTNPTTDKIRTAHGHATGSLRTCHGLLTDEHRAPGGRQTDALRSSSLRGTHVERAGVCSSVVRSAFVRRSVASCVAFVRGGSQGEAWGAIDFDCGRRSVHIRTWERSADSPRASDGLVTDIRPAADGRAFV